MSDPRIVSSTVLPSGDVFQKFNRPLSMPEIERASRDFDAEGKAANYAFSFDYIVHGYLMRIFEPHFRGVSALELGCFKGEFTQRIARHFAELTVIDGSFALVQEAMAAIQMPGMRRWMTATFEDARLPESSFDAVFMIHALEHVDDPVLVLKRIKGWLKPDGRLFLAVPNAHAASRMIAEKMGLINDCYGVTSGEKTMGHRRTYSLGTLEDDVLASGLNVIERGGVLFKAFANFQMDKALQSGIIDRRYLDGCFALGKIYPELCSSVYMVCER